MKIDVNENNNIELSEVFNGISLKSTDGEHFGICMRDGGFEFNYNGVWYEAKAGQLREMNKLDDWVAASDTCGCKSERSCDCAQPDHCTDKECNN